jgi:hypothetical protein
MANTLDNFCDLHQALVLRRSYVAGRVNINKKGLKQKRHFFPQNKYLTKWK